MPEHPAKGGWSKRGSLVFRREERTAFEVIGIKATERGRLQRQAEAFQLLLDLVNGLHTEIADVEQILLSVGHQLADGVDALTLQAVVAALRKVEILDRDGHLRVGFLGNRCRANLDALSLSIEFTAQAEKLNQRRAS